MLFTPYIRTSSQLSQIEEESFSFVDGFADEKDEMTMANSISKNSDFEATSCCTCGMGTQYQKEEEEQFFQEQQSPGDQKTICCNPNPGVTISKQISYSSPEQYERILQNLLNLNHFDHPNKIYLRLLIVDKQAAIDQRLQPYLERAMQEYRLLRQHFFSSSFNSALASSKKIS